MNVRCPASILSALAAGSLATTAPVPAQAQPAPREVIFVLRSVPESRVMDSTWCSPARTGFEPVPRGPESLLSLWSVRTRDSDGQVVDTQFARVGELRMCLGPTEHTWVWNLHAEAVFNGIAFKGRGYCRGLKLDVPEAGLSTAQCAIDVFDLPPAYAGGLLSSSSVSSRAATGPQSDPPGYAQASVAVLRLWLKP